MADYENDMDDGGQEEPFGLTLGQILSSPNLVSELPDEECAELASKVLDEYEIDDDSRADWIKRNQDAMKLATLVAEKKTYPFTGASSIKYPLITQAGLQFNARAYPAIVAPDSVVKVKTRGRDPQGLKAARASRVSEHMSDQLLNEMPEWEEDTDRLLMRVAIEGCIFRKVYYDPALGRNVTRLIPAERLVVNYQARSLADVPRISEQLGLYPFEIEERIRDGRYVEFDYRAYDKGDSEDDKGQGQDDPDGPHLFIEQHRLYDLDGDGYPEPYICTVHVGCKKLVRMVADIDRRTLRIGPDNKVRSARRNTYYVKYPFLPNPDGGFYDVGLGWLLADNNDAINTTLNMMFDAGHMQNMQGGLISLGGVTKEKKIELSRGELRVINTGGLPIGQAIHMMNWPGPSEVLFKLLGVLIDAGEKLASVKDILTGDVKQNMQPTTVLALIEQGMTVFTAIYKRIYRALKTEFDIHAGLNAANVTVEAYQQFFDDPNVNPQADYNLADMDITPVADAQTVTKMQRLTKAEAIWGLAKDNPMMNQAEALKRILEAMDAEDIENLMAQPNEADQAFAEFVKALEVEGKRTEIAKMWSEAVKNTAQAEAAEAGQQMSAYDFYLRTILAEIGAENDQRGMAGLVGQPGDQMVPGQAQQPEPGTPPAVAGTALQLDAGPAPGMAGGASQGGVPAGAL